MQNSLKLFISKAACLALLSISLNLYAKHDPYYYQLKIYHLKTQQQAAQLDDYLQHSWIPAAHRAGITGIGIFKPISPDTLEQVVYVFIPFKKINDVLKLEEVLGKDPQYITERKNYWDAPYNAPVYTRIETILLKAFKNMPQPHKPVLTASKKDRVYELRSYESATEGLGINKIGMFNDAEMTIFNKLNFNAVFYGQVIAGSHMPNLMYLTTFNNRDDRDKHWAAFKTDYKKISDLPQYQHNVSKVNITFVYPADYSDI